LNDLWLAGYEQEIERCIKIYDNFKAGSGFIRSVFDSINTYFKVHPDHAPPIEKGSLLPANSTDIMKKDISLVLRPPVDREPFCSVFKEICTTIVKTNLALKKNISNAIKMFEKYISEDSKMVSLEEIADLHKHIIEENIIAEDLATLIFTTTKYSLYKRQLKLIKEDLRTDLYEGGDCPVCGKKPHYGLLHPDNGAKHLECWLCGTRWVHPRVKCPFCSNEKREDLGFFTVEGNDTCRVNYCRVCCRYYKVYDARTFHVDGDLVLPVHNLASLGYDLLAGKEGFSPGSGLKWVNDEELSYRQD